MLDRLDVNITIPEKLEPLYTKKKRFKIAYGGRGGAKSQTFADLLALKSMTEAALIGCFREFQNSIDDSVYNLIKSEIIRLKLPGWEILKSTIDNDLGGGFRFKGLARSIDAIKSAFGFRYFWLEEGQFISQQNLDILTKTLRLEDSEIWISANPMNSADPFSQRFIVPYQKDLDQFGYYEDDLHLIVKINYYDNPWFPAVLERERRHDYETLPRALYDHIWLGAFNDSVDNSIILAEWFDAAIDAHEKLGFKPRGIKVVSHDPSDLGPDDKALSFRHGSVLLDAKLMKTGNANDGADWALDYAIENDADLFVWDGDGIGAPLVRQVETALSGKRIDYLMFKGGETPERPNEVYQGERPDKTKNKTNDELFFNRKAQAAWNLRDRFYNTWLAVEKNEYKDPDSLISVSSKIECLPQLRSETCRIPRKHNGNGKIQLMPKPEMKRLYKIESPNLFDSAFMAFLTKEKRGSGSVITNFSNPWG